MAASGVTVAHGTGGIGCLTGATIERHLDRFVVKQLSKFLHLIKLLLCLLRCGDSHTRIKGSCRKAVFCGKFQGV